MPVSLQVTIGAGARTQISAHGINFKQLIIQANGSNIVRCGDSTIVAGAYGTGKGLLIYPTGNANVGPVPIQGGILSNWYVAGTAADVVDVFYEPA